MNRNACEGLITSGATCGPCEDDPPDGGDECCPEQEGQFIEMCLNGVTVNVNRNACEGLITAGATCGPCDDD